MKKLSLILVVCMLFFAVTGCGGGSEEGAETGSGESASPAESAPEAKEEGGGKSLVVYFSATGNTEEAAKVLAEMQGADLYEITPAEPYTDEDLDYNNDDCRANTEQNDENARPAISGSIENLQDYDTVYVGFPIWWGSLPRVMYTFFESYDFSGKTIAPFCTSGGSGISAAASEIEQLASSAEVTEGIRVEPSGAESAFSGWLSEIGLAE